jgi:hypothetical protein
MNVRELKEALEGVDEKLPVVIRSGNAFYETTDADNTSIAFEISSGGHAELD